MGILFRSEYPRNQVGNNKVLSNWIVTKSFTLQALYKRYTIKVISTVPRFIYLIPRGTI